MNILPLEPSHPDSISPRASERSDNMDHNLHQLLIRLERPEVSEEIRRTYGSILREQVLLMHWTPSLRLQAICEGQVYLGAKKVGAYG